MAHLSAMLGNLASSVILYEKVKTTRAKAMAVKPMLERMVTIAKTKSATQALRYADSLLPLKSASAKLVEVLGPRYKSKKSGFLRIIPLGNRVGDAAPVVQIELT